MAYPNISNFRFVAANFSFGLDDVFKDEQEELEATLVDDINWDDPVDMGICHELTDINWEEHVNILGVSNKNYNL